MKGSKSSNSYKYEYNDRYKRHRATLGHGTLAIMYSDHTKGMENSFQRRCEHRVPPSKTVGSRMNWTVRIHNPSINIVNALQPDETADLSKGNKLLLWDRLPTMSDEEREALFTELTQAMDEHGRSDRTFVFGKWHENNGRKVLEQASEAGQSYTYGGKTTEPGVAFGPEARKTLSKLGDLLGLDDVSDFWAHLVFYPEGKCGLGWHSDAEKGINPHAIVSFTFLEDKLNGPRPFDVREKKRKRLKT